MVYMARAQTNCFTNTRFPRIVGTNSADGDAVYTHALTVSNDLYALGYTLDTTVATDLTSMVSRSVLLSRFSPDGALYNNGILNSKKFYEPTALYKREDNAYLLIVARTQTD